MSYERNKGSSTGYLEIREVSPRQDLSALAAPTVFGSYLATVPEKRRNTTTRMKKQSAAEDGDGYKEHGVLRHHSHDPPIRPRTNAAVSDKDTALPIGPTEGNVIAIPRNALPEGTVRVVI